MTVKAMNKKAEKAAWKAVEAAIDTFVTVLATSAVSEGRDPEDGAEGAKDIVRDTYRCFGG